MNELDWIVFGILAAFIALILGMVAIWRTCCFRKLEIETGIGGVLKHYYLEEVA